MDSMNVYYFPFTFVSNRTLDVLNACFQPIHVLLPSMLEIPANMNQAAQDGRLVFEPRAAGDDDIMGEVLRQYRAWAGVHQASEMGWLKSQRDTVPFYDDTNISRIRSELIGESQQQPDKDPLQEARVFLQMAQMYDAETADLETDLEYFEQMEKSLFANLQGEAATDRRPLADSALPSDPGGFMTMDRLRTWVRLFSTLAPVPSDPRPVLVTTSRAVLETLLEAVPKAENMASIERIPVTRSSGESEVQWRQELVDYLSKLSDPNASAAPVCPVPPEGAERTVSLSMYRVPGVMAEAMGTRRLSAAPVPGTETVPDIAMLAFIECKES